jgi:hypothetical protein
MYWKGISVRLLCQGVEKIGLGLGFREACQ